MGIFSLVDGIDGVSAGEDAGFFLGQFGAFQIRFAGGKRLVSRHRSFLSGGGDLRHEFVFRRKHHVSRAEQGVGARGENADF